MIVYPVDWEKDYTVFERPEYICGFRPELFLEDLEKILRNIKVIHLAYSGGIDSTIMLYLMSKIFPEVFTYTISFRHDHPDIQFARQGAELCQSKHREFIVEPTYEDSDRFEGDNAVRQLFKCLEGSVDSIICCDGIDELMCGYYKHQNVPEKTYRYFLSRLLSDHLIPLNLNSGDIEVYLPFLDCGIIDFCKNISLQDKVDELNRKKPIKIVSDYLQIPEYFYMRRKYGFCDAFRIKQGKVL